MDEERSIEPSGEQQKAKLELGLTATELKLIALALNDKATRGEIANASASLMSSLRARGVRAEEFEPLLFIEPEVPVEIKVDHHQRHRSHFEILTAHVLGVTAGRGENDVSGVLSNLAAQFLQQAIVTGRI